MEMGLDFILSQTSVDSTSVSKTLNACQGMLVTLGICEHAIVVSCDKSGIVFHHDN